MSIDIEWDDIDEQASKQGQAIKDIHIMKPKLIGKKQKISKKMVFGGGFNKVPRYKKRGLRFDNLPNIVVFNILDND